MWKGGGGGRVPKKIVLFQVTILSGTDGRDLRRGVCRQRGEECARKRAKLMPPLEHYTRGGKKRARKKKIMRGLETEATSEKIKKDFAECLGARSASGTKYQ